MYARSLLQELLNGNDRMHADSRSSSREGIRYLKEQKRESFIYKGAILGTTPYAFNRVINGKSPSVTFDP